MGRVAGAAVIAVLAIGLAACGGSDEPDRPELIVFAASSLGPALEEYASDFDSAEVKLSLGGSDELAAQIRQGLVPDVYASADIELPKALARERLASEPTVVATNRLVLATAPGNGIERIDELAGPGVRIAIGSETVPVGSYAREAIASLPQDTASGILSNLASRESSASGILGKLTQGAVDAGFLYATDLGGAPELGVMHIPDRVQPRIAYGATVPEGANRPREARRFIAGLLDGAGRRALRAAGFGAAGR